MMKEKIPVIGIAYSVFYFISVGIFLITKTEAALTIWETATIFGAPVVLFVLLELAESMNIISIYKNAMLVFMSCTCALTGLAHTVNITVTRKLMSQGAEIPEYLQIGFWPSVEMAVDYLAWGFFMALAFFSIGLTIDGNEKSKMSLKITVVTCGILCLLGFLGTVFINENLWYLAPVGYGGGTIVICTQMMNIRKYIKKK